MVTLAAAARRLGVASVAACLLAGTSGAPARADDLTTAKARVAAASERLAALESRISIAQEAYARTVRSVGQQVLRSVSDQTARQDADRRARSARSAVGASARALYISGGQVALYASALSAGSTTDLSLRLAAVTRVMRTADLRAGAAEDAASHALLVAQRSSEVAGAAIVTAEQVRARADDLDRLFEQAQAELDRLSEQAQSLQQARDAAAALAAARAGAAASAGAAYQQVAVQIPPAAYFRLYRAAATTCPGMSWTLLAAVGQVESGHGRTNGPSSAGAVGPMQFMPATFAAYAVDGDQDGTASPWSPADAVYTAARYLCVNGSGSPATVRRALFAYNHARWYVDLVLGVQAAIATSHA